MKKDKLFFIKIAARITDAVLAKTLPHLREGVAEKEVAAQIVRLTKKYGCTLSFPPIVAFGRWTAYPHHKVSRRRLRRGDLILIDLGARYRGYCADLTRMFTYGQPSVKLVKLVKLVQKAQSLAFRQIKAGLGYREADQLIRNYLLRHGVKPEHLRHGLGHGIGRRVHEGFILSIRQTHPKGVHRHTFRVCKPEGQLRIGDIFTLEPGVYIKGVGGARIEDTVVLTGTGIKTLTRFPKTQKVSRLLVNDRTSKDELEKGCFAD